MPILLDSLKSEWAIGAESNSKEPLYHQLYMLLKNSITDGSVEHGKQMPTEQQLAETFEVSRITVKRAMDDLAAEKLIARRRGKGSHVIYHYVPEPVKAPLVGMLENLAELGKRSQIKAVSIEDLVPPASIRKELGLVDDGKATKMIRVRSNEDGIPYAYYRSWTLKQKRGFTKRNVEGKTRLAILKDNGIKIAKVEQTLAAENASQKIASELQIAPGSALLSLQRHYFDDRGALVDILSGLYNPKMFTYKMVLGFD